MREIFHKADLDHNGVLTIEEVSGALKQLNIKLSGIELQDLFLAADKDKSGAVDIEEFFEMLVPDPLAAHTSNASPLTDPYQSGSSYHADIAKAKIQSVDILSLDLKASGARAVMKSARVKQGERMDLISCFPLAYVLPWIHETFNSNLLLFIGCFPFSSQLFLYYHTQGENLIQVTQQRPPPPVIPLFALR